VTTVGLCALAVALVLLPGRPARRMPLPPEERRDTRRPRRRGHRVDPLAVATAFDLLAACLRAGLPMATAASSVATFAPDPMGPALRRAADLMTLGADPTVAWADCAADDATQALARMARRSARSGASLAAGIAELADQRRSAAADSAAAKAERAGVMIAGPLGLCFLPAFVCLGIVPVVIGLAGRVLDGAQL